MKKAALVLVAPLLALAAACGGENKPAAVPETKAPPSAETTQSPVPSQETQEKMAVNLDEAIYKACNIKAATVDEGPKFDFDSDQLSEPEKQILEQVGRCLTTGALKGRAVDLVGRADPRGETEYNMTLGARRARAAHTFLSGLGVGQDKLFDTSRGELDATGTDEQGWKRDRRVDVKLRN